MRYVFLVPPSLVLTLLVIGALGAWRSSVSSLVEMIRVGLSWPVLAVVLVSLFLWCFQEHIKKLIDELMQIRTPSFGFSRQKEPKEAPTAISKAIVDGLVQHVTAQRDSLWEFVLEVERQAAASAYSEERGRLLIDAVTWRFRYADLFLVPITKRVLHWMTTINSPINRESFEVVWQPVIQDPQQRQAVLNVLIHVGLIRNEAGSLSVSDLSVLYTRFGGNQAKQENAYGT